MVFSQPETLISRHNETETMNTSVFQPQSRHQSRPFASLHARVKRSGFAVALGLVAMGSPSIGYALSFNFIPAAGTTQAAIDGFAAAGTRWSSLYTDNVTVNINIDFSTLGSGILGQAGSTQALYSYTNVKNAMTLDRTSADDFTAVANLQAGSGLRLLMNRTSDNPNGAGSAGLFIDANGSNNNSNIRMTNANAKALGLLAGNNAAIDANISFSNAFTWDFDPSNGITAGAFDFVGIATHEIGHALGFISGVDILDINSTSPNFFPSGAFTYVSTLDLFRHSAIGDANGALDWAADTRSKYFSIDGGATVGPQFATGSVWGDGQQASHWKDNLGIGVMDPTAAPGELLGITANDIQAFDVIGWNRADASVPDEASSLALLGLGVVAIAGLRRRLKVSTTGV